MKSIRLIRLQTGEDILAKVDVISIEHGDKDLVVFSEEQVLLEEPVVVYMRETQPGRFGIGLLPWIPYKKHKYIFINVDKIVCVTTPDQELQSKYEQATSAIVLPDNNIMNL